MKSAVALVKSVFILTGICIFILLSDLSVQAVQDGLQICINAVLPVLFPIFVLSDLWVRCGAAIQTAALFAPFMERIFHLPGVTSSAFLLGCMGGYPVGAKTVAQLFRDGCISKQSAGHALMFCNNAGPSFIIGVVGFGVFQSSAAGLLLYAIHIFSAVGIGILFRPKHTDALSGQYVQKTEPFIIACKNAIYESGKTAGIVCIFILFFSVITRNITALCSGSFFLSVIMPGFLEITNGIHILSNSTLPPRIVFSISALLLGFSGCSVIMQSISFTASAGLSCKRMLLGKALQGSLSFLAAYMLWPVLSKTIGCFQPNTVFESGSQPYLLQLFCLIFLLFLKKASGKKEICHI